MIHFRSGFWSLLCVCVCVFASHVRGCIQKVPDWVDNEIDAYNYKHSLRSNAKGYGGKFTRLAHKIAIQVHLVPESFTICSSRSLQAPSPETYGHTLLIIIIILRAELYDFFFFKFYRLEEYGYNSDVSCVGQSLVHSVLTYYITLLRLGYLGGFHSSIFYCSNWKETVFLRRAYRRWPKGDG
jgi:hypothetical protein